MERLLPRGRHDIVTNCHHHDDSFIVIGEKGQDKWIGIERFISTPLGTLRSTQVDGMGQFNLL